MRATDLAIRVATKHARDLDHAGILVKHGRVGRGDSAHSTFLHGNVVICMRGDLREMGNRQYLVVFGNALHQRANLPGDRTTDTSIDLIENECWHVLQSRQHGAQRKHQAR